jgi:gliding motility-associated-like protein
VPPFSVDLGSDTVICYGTTVPLDAGISGDNYTWSNGANSKMITANNAGRYYVTVSRNTCIASDTINVQIRQEPVFAINDPKWNCAFDTAQLNASGGHIYNWLHDDGLSNYTIANPRVVTGVTKEYTVTITDTICNKSATLSTVVNALPLPNVQITKSNDIDCRNMQSQLNVTGVGTRFEWTPSPSLSSTEIKNPIATPTTTTSYIVKGTVANGCSAYDTLEVIVYPKPVIRTSNDTTICKNTAAQLWVAGGNTYEWSPSITLNNPSSSSPQASPTVNTKYYVKVTDNIACEYLDSVSVFITPDPTFTVTTDPEICKEGKVQLLATGGDTYNWSPSDGLTNANIANPVASPINTKDYTVTITKLECNQTSSLTTKIVVLPSPEINANKSNDIDCSQFQSQLTASGAAKFIWTPATTLSNANIFNPIASPNVTTSYIVKGISNLGCEGFDTVVVKVENINKSGYLMPNAFSPNNDGMNDCFRVKYWGTVDDFEFSIYNRWGVRLFRANTPEACWDGTYKGVLQDGGVYVYMIKARTFCEPKVFRKGTFVLVR